MSKHYGENTSIIWTDKKRILGMPISIENPKGSYRKYKDENGDEKKNLTINY